MEHTSFEAYSTTDKGPVRGINDDSCGLRNVEDLVIAWVADGVGGYENSNIPSEIVYEEFALAARKGRFKDYHSWRKTMDDILNRADARITAIDNGLSTCTAVVINDAGNYCVAHVGDGRAYAIMPDIDKIKQITTDHVRDDGTPFAALGAEAVGFDFSVDHLTGYLNRGEYMLLCTDGLTSMLTNEEIMNIFSKGDSIIHIANDLVTGCLEKGGIDNITAVVIRYDPSSKGQHLIRTRESTSESVGQFVENAMTKYQKSQESAQLPTQ